MERRPPAFAVGEDQQVKHLETSGISTAFGDKIRLSGHGKGHRCREFFANFEVGVPDHYALNSILKANDDILGQTQNE